jgi:hypothetical protein
VSFSFVQALYDPSKTLPTERLDFEAMLMDHDFISVAPQVYQLLKNQGRLEDIPLIFHQQLKNEFQKAFYQNLFIKNQTEMILKRFEEEGIEVIPLKGVYFAEKYFGHLGARTTSDIDLLIKLPYLERAMDVVQSLGFTTEEDKIAEHFHCSFSKELPGSHIPLKVELHWNLLIENTSRFEVHELWEEAQPVGVYQYVKQLSHYHTFYMICLHSWRHNLASLRYYMDILQVVYALEEELDFQRLRIDIEAHHTSKRMIRTLSLVDLQIPELKRLQKCTFISTKNSLREIAFKNRHKKGFWKYIDFIDYQIFSYDTPRHSLRHVKHLLKKEKIG